MFWCPGSPGFPLITGFVGGLLFVRCCRARPARSPPQQLQKTGRRRPALAAAVYDERRSPSDRLELD
jgi:hypothetical protein